MPGLAAHCRQLHENAPRLFEDWPPARPITVDKSSFHSQRDNWKSIRSVVVVFGLLPSPVARLQPRDVRSDFRFGNFLELNGANGTQGIATQSDASLRETVALWGKWRVVFTVPDMTGASKLLFRE